MGSYWEANMELIDLIPEFNLYEEFWKIYTKQATIEPQYISGNAYVEKAIISAGAEIYGTVKNCVIGAGVVIGEGTEVHDSIIMAGTKIGEHCYIEKAIIAEDCVLGDNITMGAGEEAPSELNESVYSFGLVTVGAKSVIPSGVTIGKNTAIKGETSEDEYPDGKLPAGGFIVKGGDEK